ncbi:hypothetical protein GLYMA_06G024200v4 [Glycine max]|nr:hypothetical protein GLYMA_06G024200v4 [Glycine max]KAH1123834.1 hypothetical protein GYH30_013864 [Glycine max]
MMMKQGASENEVAEILLSLPSLIREFECGCGILPPPSWGCKRKRSTIAVDPKTLQKAASSPATPLSFSLSESDENPTTLVSRRRRRRRRNVSLKRKREHYLRIIQDLTKDNDLLRGIKNVNGYCDMKKEYNLKLKARKQELSQGGLVHKQAQQQFQFSGMAHHPPLILNQTAGSGQIKGGEGVVGLAHATTSLGVASLSSSNNVGPVGIPDLNLPLDEPMTMEFCEALDMNVADKNLSRSMAAAQARQNRLQKYRFKNPIGISKPRYSCR